MPLVSTQTIILAAWGLLDYAAAFFFNELSINNNEKKIKINRLAVTKNMVTFSSEVMQYVGIAPVCIICSGLLVSLLRKLCKEKMCGAHCSMS